MGIGFFPEGFSNFLKLFQMIRSSNFNYSEALAKAPDKSRLVRRPSSQRLKIKGNCHCERSAAI